MDKLRLTVLDRQRAVIVAQQELLQERIRTGDVIYFPGSPATQGCPDLAATISEQPPQPFTTTAARVGALQRIRQQQIAQYQADRDTLLAAAAALPTATTRTFTDVITQWSPAGRGRARAACATQPDYPETVITRTFACAPASSSSAPPPPETLSVQKASQGSARKNVGKSDDKPAEPIESQGLKARRLAAARAYVREHGHEDESSGYHTTETSKRPTAKKHSKRPTEPPVRKPKSSSLKPPLTPVKGKGKRRPQDELDEVSLSDFSTSEEESGDLDRWPTTDSSSVSTPDGCEPRDPLERGDPALAGQCIFCYSWRHNSGDCDRVEELTTTQRWLKVQINSACIRCLNKNHHLSACTSKLQCRQCMRRHHELLHEDEKTPLWNR